MFCKLAEAEIIQNFWLNLVLRISFQYFWKKDNKQISSAIFFFLFQIYKISNVYKSEDTQLSIFHSVVCPDSVRVLKQKQKTNIQWKKDTHRKLLFSLITFIKIPFVIAKNHFSKKKILRNNKKY